MVTHRHNIVIDDQIWRGLSTFIVNKQGDIKKGDLSKWVNIGISNLIQGLNARALSARNTNPYQIPKGRLKIKDMMLDICNEFVRSGIRTSPLSQGNTVLLKHLEKIIQDVTGHHEHRAIKNHIRDLIKYGYIKDSGGIGTFLILDTGTDIEWIERIQEQQKHDERSKQQEELKKQGAIKQKGFDTIIEELK